MPSPRKVIQDEASSQRKPRPRRDGASSSASLLTAFPPVKITGLSSRAAATGPNEIRPGLSTTGQFVAIPGGLDLTPGDGSTQPFARLHVAAGRPMIESP